VKQAIRAISPGKSSKPKILETGIKMIDLMTPLPTRGAVGLFGLQGVGRAVLVMELYHRLQKGKGQLAIFYFATGQEAPNLRAVVEREPNFPADSGGPLQTAWLVSPKATDPDYANRLDRLDVSIYFSPLLSCQDKYPPIDCSLSKSKLLTIDVVGKEHVRIAERVRQALKNARELTFDRKFYELVANGAYAAAREHAKKVLPETLVNLDSSVRGDVSRARKLELFLTQPFFSAESYTGKKGCRVALADTIAGCRAILDGDVDEISEDRFGFSGSLDEIRTL
jgi:F-type H+-transporting ATPase subunit beta